MYIEDMRALGVTSVTRYARATDDMPPIISKIARLLQSGHAPPLTDAQITKQSTRHPVTMMVATMPAASCGVQKYL